MARGRSARLCVRSNSAGRRRQRRDPFRGGLLRRDPSGVFRITESRGTGPVVRQEIFLDPIGADAATDWLPSEIARDEHGFVLTGADAMKAGQWKADREPFALETSAPGIFAIGDVRSGSVKRVAAAVGEGGIAIAFVHRYL